MERPNLFSSADRRKVIEAYEAIAVWTVEAHQVIGAHLPYPKQLEGYDISKQF